VCAYNLAHNQAFFYLPATKISQVRLGEEKRRMTDSSLLYLRLHCKQTKHGSRVLAFDFVALYATYNLVFSPSNEDGTVFKTGVILE